MNKKFYPIFGVLPLGLILLIYHLHRTNTIFSPPHISFVHGSTNNKLEVLDWGGEGRPILFLAGYGNSAHVFDDFAPKFTDAFHVYAYTRRGFGASAHTATGYSIDTLANDLLAVIDSLHLTKVILIGHSIAGDELTKFATAYPDRVEKLVYLDAAYDHTVFFKKNAAGPSPAYPPMTKEDSSSVEKLNAYGKKIAGVAMPTDELKQISQFSTTGKYEKDVTPDSLILTYMKGIVPPDYKPIKCPALAIYAKLDNTQQIIPFYATLDSTNKKISNTRFQVFKGWQTEAETQFGHEALYGTVKEVVGANHYLFISNEGEVEAILKGWL